MIDTNHRVVDSSLPIALDGDRHSQPTVEVDSLVSHWRSPITIYHSRSIGNRFLKQKMLEDIGGISAQSRLGDGSEKRGRTGNKAGQKRGVCGVTEWSEKQGKWRDTSVRAVVIVLCI